MLLVNKLDNPNLFIYRRTKWKRLNEARYNLLSDGVDSRLLRKDSPYYAHAASIAVPSFPSKVCFISLK